MAVAKKYNSATQQWEPFLAGGQGIAGPEGPSGVVSVQAPLVNSGTSSSAIIGVQSNPIFSGNLSATNIGVGTTTPAINSTGSAIQVHAPTGQSSAIHFTTGSTGSAPADGMIVGRWGDGSNLVYTYEPEPILFGTSGTIRQVIDSAGRITQSSQPSFAARSDQSTTQGNDIVWNFVDYNVGSHYNSSNGRFTAPVDGYYIFHAHGLWGNGDSGDRRVALYKNGGGFPGMRFITNKVANVWWTWYVDGIVYMAAGDYATIRIEQSGQGIHTDNNYNQFSGRLLG